MRPVRNTLAVALGATLALACGHPCEDLARETCALKGPGSAACATARETAGQSSGRDHRACALALEVLKGGRAATR